LCLKQLAWRLALTEARNTNFLSDFAECLVDIAVKLDLVNLYRNFYFVALEGLNNGFHRAQSVPFPFVTASWKPHALATPHEGQINLKMGDTVSLTTEVDGLPVGTEGKVILANGFNWLRYRVRFSNGTEIGDLDHRHLQPIGKTARRLARAAKRA
jgi:hypothetical protein